MITKINNEMTLCRMGIGKLYGAIVEDNNHQPVGISFTNNPNMFKNALIFKIDTIEGVAGYLQPLILLMEEWEKKNVDKYNEAEIQLIKEIQKLKPFIGICLPQSNET